MTKPMRGKSGESHVIRTLFPRDALLWTQRGEWKGEKGERRVIETCKAEGGEYEPTPLERAPMETHG